MLKTLIFSSPPGLNFLTVTSKAKRYSSGMPERKSAVEQPPSIQDMPPEPAADEVTEAYHLLAQHLNQHERLAPLKHSEHRHIATLKLGERVMHISSLDGVRPVLGTKTSEYFFELAEHMGGLGLVAVPCYRFDSQSKVHDSANLLLGVSEQDGFLVYSADGRLMRQGGHSAPAHTTGRRRLQPSRVPVSFVGVPTSGLTLDTRMAAGTEIFQNRLTVLGVCVDGEAPDTERAHLAPFQETFTGSMGNILGHVAAGSTYRAYKKHVESMRIPGIWGYALSNSDSTIAAPRLLAHSTFYEQIADRDFPAAEDLQFKPVIF